MLLGIVSDTHSRHQTTLTALARLRERGVTTVLHCGDIEDPATVRLFCGLDAHFVFGNCDYDLDDLRAAMAEIGATSHEYWGSLELEGRKIAFLHGHQHGQMRDLEDSGHFDFLFYGHTHVAKEHRTGPTRVINPGALHRARPKTFLILDLATAKVEWVPVEVDV
jgi:putative phosphoesterase